MLFSKKEIQRDLVVLDLKMKHPREKKIGFGGETIHPSWP